MNANTKLIIGIILLVLANLLPLVAVPVAASSLPIWLKTIVAGLLVIGGPEVVMIAAIAMMGKENYERIIKKVREFFHKIKPAGNVSKTRYTIGLVMFLLPIIPSYIMAYAPHLLPEASPLHLYVSIAADVMFLASLFVLGGDFWDKLRALFTWDARATFPQKNEMKEEVKENSIQDR